MGGIIFVALAFLGLVIVVMRLIGSRGRPPAPEGDAPQTAHEAVISRLEDHRRRRSEEGTGK